MRILIVTLSIFGGLKKGGGERYATELFRALQNRGHQVKAVVVERMGSIAEQDAPDNTVRKIKILEFIRLVKSAEVVHVHQLNSPGFDYALLACKLLRKPLILTDHGGGALTPGRAIGKVRLRYINAAGFVSSWSRHDIDPAGVIDKFQVIFGGGDHLPPAKRLPETYDFGFVGRLVPHKGAHILIEALPPEAKLIVAGQVRDVEYKRLLDSLSAGKKVTFLPDASDEMVAQVHRSVKFLAIPSVNRYREAVFARPELLGLVALEALAVGTPVVGSEVGGLAEILRAAEQTIAPPGDVEAWKSILQELLVKPQNSISTDDFTWDAVAAKCEKIYDSALVK